MAAHVGIGIITCNRRDVLAETLDRVRAHTKTTYSLAVADDGSGDGTAELIRSQNVSLITGPNRGIAWNKNRALFLLAAMRRCDVVILLEDDSYPTEDGWEKEWIEATQRWGHVNLAGEWFRGSFIKGEGTVDDPILSADVTAQCSGFSHAALSYAGYFDSRFRGYGFEHLEHSRRMVRLGYGGSFEELDGGVVPIYRLLKSCIEVSNPGSFSNREDRARNELLCQLLLNDEGYRMPWHDETDMRQFRAEIAGALTPG